MNSGLTNLVSEIRGAVDAGFYAMPVILAAALPDVCSALASEDGRASRDTYKDWYNTWAASILTNFTADDCYSFRCGVVHQGRMGDMKSSYARAIFPIPNKQNNTFMDCVINDAYLCGVEQFCNSMIQAAETWYQAEQNSPNVLKNLPRMMQVHPAGLTPYFVGSPVLA